LSQQRALVAHPLQPRLVAETLLIGYRDCSVERWWKRKHLRPHPAQALAPACCRSTSAKRPRCTPRTCRFLKGGGIFIPTSRQYTLGEEVFMLLSLMDDPNRLAVQGKVVWLTPEGVQGNRTQGIGVQFTQDETGGAARATIEKILGETLGSTRPTHTM
jgi:type IV pilus assembly protein PilZ